MSEHVDRKLDAYHDGRLDPAESDRVRAHLERCADCRAASEEHQRFESLLLRAARPESAPTRSLWPGVRARLAPAGRERRRPSAGFAGGMALAAAAGIALSVLLPEREPASSSAETTLWQALDYGAASGTPINLAAFEPEENE